MLVLLHVSIALISLVFSGLLVFYPSSFKLRISYGLITLTLISGFGLAATKPAHILSVCLSGLIYVSVVTGSVMIARSRLAKIDKA